MSDLELRPAVDEDFEELNNLFACCFGEETDCVLDLERDYPYLKGVQGYYGSCGGNILVAENHLGIVGVISWLPLAIDTSTPDFGLSKGILLHHLYVHPLVRRQRLAMDMVFAVIDKAEAIDCPIIDLWMNVKFHRGHKFIRFMTFDATRETRFATDLQKSTERRYTLDVDDFLDALEQDPQFYDDFFAPPDEPDEETYHEDIDDPSQFIEDNTETWR